jgi:hypothetical protein
LAIYGLRIRRNNYETTPSYQIIPHEVLDMAAGCQAADYMLDNGLLKGE